MALTAPADCSFCGKPRTLFAGDAAAICDDCVGLCCAILAERVGTHVEPEIPASQLSVEWIMHVTRRLDQRAITTPCTCSFCGGDSSDAAAMIAGPRVFICEACVVRGVSEFVSATPRRDDLR